MDKSTIRRCGATCYHWQSVKGWRASGNREYADLRADGDDTLGARLSANLDELSACAGALEDKIAAYRQMIAQAPAENEENDHAPIS